MERECAIRLAPDAWAWRSSVIAIAVASVLHAGMLGAALSGSLARDPPDEPPPIPVEILLDPKPSPRGANETDPEELPMAGEHRDRAVGSPPDASAEPSPEPAPAPGPAVEPQESAAAPIADAPMPEEAAAPSLPANAAPAPPETEQETAALAPLPVPRAKPDAPPPRAGTRAALLLLTPPARARDKTERRGEGGGARYVAGMKECILRKGRYPPAVRALGFAGTAQYEVTLDRRGRLLGLQVVKSSGFDILNETGMAMIKPCSPFGPFTPDMSG